MSIYEEGTISVVAPMMEVFNNLVVFDPNQKENSLDDIVPDLADSLVVGTPTGPPADLQAAIPWRQMAP